MRVALVCIAKNEDAYIQEWLDYHLKLGVDSVFIYENDWRSGIEREGIHTIPWDGVKRQVAAYNDFLFKRHDFDWAVFIDIDEFIVLNKHDNLKCFLSQYSDTVALNWMMFGDNGQENTEGSVLERFTCRGTLPDRHVKCIVNLRKPGRMRMVDPHAPNTPWIDTNGNTGTGQNNYDGDNKIAQINHYFCKTRQEYAEKIARGRADWHTARTWEEFEQYNQNEVEDFTARDFKWKQQ